MGCHALRPQTGRSLPKSEAVAPVANAAFGKDAPASTSHVPGTTARVSGVASMEDGFEAFATRVALARHARQSLDIQYYIWDGDQTGTYLLAELLEAADRGVRIRLLLDDITSGGLVDGLLIQLTAGAKAAATDLEEGLSRLTPDRMAKRDRVRDLMDEINSGGRDLVAAALDTHPNIEVRMFNPFDTRSGGIKRAFHLLANFSRLNRRMHNKVFAADNQLAIVGGRNIADNYFGLHAKYDFRDLDLLVRGPVVRDISANFDHYWNSEWAVPVHAFSWKQRSEKRFNDLRGEMAAFFREAKHGRLAKLDHDAETTRVLQAVSARMVQAPVSVVANLPGRLHPTGEPLVAEALASQSLSSGREILVESAYFVPVNVSFERMQERVGHGVRVAVLTNSLASTNQMPAHAGYAKHRARLLRTGVELYELKPHPDHTTAHSGGGPRTVLHTKAVVFDRQRVFVGTFNLDPRSADLNTEIGLLVENPSLAAGVAAYIEKGMAPDQSWRIFMGHPLREKGRRSRNGICWVCGEKHDPEVVHREPHSTLGSRLLLRFISWLPIDGML